MRWPFGPPHLTPKPSKKNKKETKNTKNHQKNKRELCSYQSFLSFFGGCPKFPFFDNLAKKARTPKNTVIIILGNYLEIGNALPYRKNCFQELFGPVIAIKSVRENLAGKVFFLFVPEKPGKAPPLSAQLSLASGLVLAQAFFWGFSGIIPVKNSERGIKSVKQITVTGKIAAGNYLAIRNEKPNRINCSQKLNRQ